MIEYTLSLCLPEEYIFGYKHMYYVQKDTDY